MNKADPSRASYGPTTKRSSVNITPEALHEAQVASAMTGKTMQDFCSQAIRDAAAKVEKEYQKGKEL